MPPAEGKEETMPPQEEEPAVEAPTAEQDAPVEVQMVDDEEDVSDLGLVHADMVDHLYRADRNFHDFLELHRGIEMSIQEVDGEEEDVMGEDEHRV